MRKIYLTRHGQTLFNKMKKRQGWCDSPLTPEGIEDTKKAAKYFKDQGIHFDKAYCSTQERASDTLEILTDLPYERLKDLKEWNFGDFEGQDDALGSQILNQPGRLSFEDWWVQFGGEDVKEVAQRIRKAMKYISESDGDTAIVVSHGGAIWSLIVTDEHIRENLEKYNLHKGIGNLMTLEFDVDEEGEYKLAKGFLPFEIE